MIKKRVILDIVADCEDDEPLSLLFDDICSEIDCCWHHMVYAIKEAKVEDIEADYADKN